jgi:hypothetical protein
MDNQSDLPSWRIFSVVDNKFRRSAMTIFLMDLGEFTGDTEATARIQLIKIRKTGSKTMRGFEIDPCYAQYDSPAEFCSPA